MMPPNKNIVLKDTQGLVDSLKDGLFERWMARAQKEALSQWRDRDAFPSLGDRFTTTAYAARGFARRFSKKKDKPPFFASGDLRSLIRKRKPRTTRRSGQVITRFKYGGGALNFLKSNKGLTASGVSHSVANVSRPASTRSAATVSAHSRGTGIYVRSFTRRGGPVRAYASQRKTRKKEYSFAARSFAQEFEEFSADKPWIIRRVSELFTLIARKASIDRRTGGIKSAVLKEHDNG